MKLSEYKKFLDLYESLNESCATYLSQDKLTITKVKVVDIYDKFVVVCFEAGKGEEFKSLSLDAFIDDFSGGCSGCQRTPKLRKH